MCFFVFLIRVSEPASLCSPRLPRLPARHGRGVRGSAREIFHELPDAYRNGDGNLLGSDQASYITLAPGDEAFLHAQSDRGYRMWSSHEYSYKITKWHVYS